jgi:hypothetical protein
MRRLTSRDTKDLRGFGLGLAGLLLAIFWIVLPWLGARPRPAWPLVAGGVVAAVALAWPAAILPVYRALVPVARLVGTINTWLLLGVLFFGILTPVGWALRRLGRLQYQTRFDTGAASYRIDVPVDRVVRLEEPF